MRRENASTLASGTRCWLNVSSKFENPEMRPFLKKPWVFDKLSKGGLAVLHLEVDSRKVISLPPRNVFQIVE